MDYYRIQPREIDYILISINLSIMHVSCIMNYHPDFRDPQSADACGRRDARGGTPAELRQTIQAED